MGYKTRKGYITNYVLGWMEKHAHGAKSARKRGEILPHLQHQISERTFRSIVTTLKHEGHLASHPEKGYWFVPLHTNDPYEIEWAKRSWLDMRSRAMDMLKDCDRHITELSRRVSQNELFQLEETGA